METNDVIALGGAFAALGAAALACVPWVRGALNAQAFAIMVVKLAKAGNVERAKKLCAAAPNAPFVMGTAAALAALPEAPEGEEGADFLRKQFRAPIRAWIDRASRIWVHVAIAAAGAGVAFALPRKSLLPITGAIAGFSVLVFAYVWSSAKKLANATVVEGDQLCGALIESRSLGGD
jgi:hypothetical protein